jgi:hypothetical protein
LGFLNYSHSPHYHAEPARRPLYHNYILNGSLKAGYACDDRAGLLFINGAMRKSVSLDSTSNNYFVSLVDGKIKEELLPAEIIKAVAYIYALAPIAITFNLTRRQFYS